MFKILQIDVPKLLKGADKLRRIFNGDKVDLCSIVNGKCGRCSEDCKFCSQSAYYNTEIQSHQLIDYEKILNLALENENEGVNRYSIVTSGRGLQGEEFKEIVGMYIKLKKDTNISLCASLGIISKEQLKKLKDIGVEKYHHNLETSRRYYSKICSTHSYDERIETLKNARKVGLKLCCGGIIGMGETMRDRINLAFLLKELEIESIPINILTPIKGTPLQNIEPLQEEEILKTIAIFKFINPRATIRFAGGRGYLEDYGEKAFLAGVSATITRNYLTTSGNKIKDDIRPINKVRTKNKQN
ncbi:biotin synthase BioB [Clostridium sp. ZC22-4]|uniref:Biotin synthase n=1 Tax=Clostridium brassicae TaxID=2999072 RepID=A0ABT4DF57_9CLOT|nr:biotin synthase BioB [Clostridium brassicae]MCY6960303.1 biotin synthase BioB [Clostridium brassicae]